MSSLIELVVANRTGSSFMLPNIRVSDVSLVSDEVSLLKSLTTEEIIEVL
jgi:hypothetical protein